MPRVRVRPGLELGPYRLVQPIGHGGMGAVWRAEDTSAGRRCAVKLLTSELAREERFRERFRREASYASSLLHPHVVRVYGAGEHEDLLYLAMQFVDGADLGVLLGRRGRFEPLETVSILTQVADALDAAHSTGLLHRDVKPGNIIIETGTQHAYLADFGLGKNPAQDPYGLTAAGAFVGTIDYTAPELILAEPFDHRVDVYSLACVMYELLTGWVPFRRTRDAEVLQAHLHDPPPLLTDKRLDVSAALEQAIVRGMAKDPDERFESCGELMRAARAAVEPRPAGTRPAPADWFEA